MKLKNNFFQIKDCCKTAQGMDFTIELNPEHYIFKAHFPTNPITPGVCIIQIIKELASEILGCDLFLKKLNNVKFLNIINPIENKEVIFSISIASEGDAHIISTVVYNNKLQFAKLSMLFTINH
jgi:3-hydroxyacyl-[acyl-carrier-protein] dehydratase